MSRWTTLNCWAGYAIFGLPAVLAVPALIATFAQFGVRDTLVSGVPAALWVCTPALLWLRYARRRPTRRRGRIAWAMLGLLTITMILISPIWFWSGPLLLVLSSEAVRVATAAHATAHRHHRTTAATKVAAPLTQDAAA